MRSVLKLNYLLYYFFSSQGDAIEYFILNKKSISSLSLSFEPVFVVSASKSIDQILFNYF